jgi:hypothetical protein
MNERTASESEPLKYIKKKRDRLSDESIKVLRKTEGKICVEVSETDQVDGVS